MGATAKRRMHGLAWAAAMLATATPLQAQPAWTLRAGTGEGFDALAVEARWRARSIERHLPADLETRWELALSHWERAGHAIDAARFGPAFEIPFARTLRLSLGVQPTLLASRAAGKANLGGVLQFTSHLGIRHRYTPLWALEARLAHTSNAGLYRHNPGVDLATLGLSYRF